MTAITLLVLLNSLIINGQSQYSSFHKDPYTDVFSAVCPYNNQCSRNATKLIPPGDDRVPCCWQCQCDDFCTIRQDCCPDVRPIGQRDELVTQKDGTLPVCFEAAFNQHLPGGGNIPHPSYLMWTDCPSDTLDRSRCLSNDTLESVVIVTDQVSEKHYRNKFCAICNNASNTLLTWKVTLRCFSNPFLEDVFEDADSIFNKTKRACTFLFKPPESIASNKHRCISSEIERSTKTCQTSSKTMARRCRLNTGPGLIFVPREPCDKHSSNYRSFYNVFCALCSLGSFMSPCTELCSASVNIPSSNRNLKMRFSAILEPYTSEPEIQPFFKACNRQEIYDIHTDKCRRLFCPSTYQPAYGTCKALVQHSSDYLQMVKVFIELEGQHDLKTAELPNLPDLGKALTNQLGLPTQSNCRSQLSETTQLWNGMRQFLFLEYVVVFKGDKSNEYRIKALRPLTDRKNPLALNITGKSGQSLSLYASMYPNNLDPRSMSSVVLQEYGSDIHCQFIIYNKVLFCPHIEIDISDVSFINDTLLLPYTDRRLVAYEYMRSGRGSVFVCESDYFKGKISEHTVSSSPVVPLSFTCIVSSIVCLLLLVFV